MENEAGPKPPIYDAYGYEQDEHYLSQTEKEALADPLVKDISETIGQKAHEGMRSRPSSLDFKDDETFIYDELVIPRPAILVKWVLDHLREQGKLKEEDK